MTSCLLTGGLGDIVAVEAVLPPAFRQTINRLYLATPQAQNAKALLDALPAEAFPRLSSVEVVPVEFSGKFRCIAIKQQLQSYLIQRGQSSHWLTSVHDASIALVFPKVHAGELTYQGSSFARYQLARLPAGLPPRYAAIHPSSTDNFQERSFDLDDWRATAALLDDLDLTGVVIGRNAACPFDPPAFLDLVGKTSIAEAVEVVKHASAFVGVDSCFSCLSAKVLPADKIHIRTEHARYLMPHASIYYAPLSNPQEFVNTPENFRCRLLS